jgi:hypothetical protein
MQASGPEGLSSEDLSLFFVETALAAVEKGKSSVRRVLAA